MSLFGRWREYHQQYGAIGLTLHLIERMLRPIWERSGIILMVLTEPQQPVNAKIPIDIRELTPAEALATTLATPDWSHRWDRGEVCYGAWTNGVCVHYSWVSRRPTVIGEIHRIIEIGPDQAYVYDCFTSARYRGQGIYPAVLSTLAIRLLNDDCSEVWIVAEEENHSSIRGLKRAGFKVSGHVHHTRLFTWESVETRPIGETPLPKLLQPK